jgi:hypothetical protein
MGAERRRSVPLFLSTISFAACAGLAGALEDSVAGYWAGSAQIGEEKTSFSVEFGEGKDGKPQAKTDFPELHSDSRKPKSPSPSSSSRTSRTRMAISRSAVPS